MDDDALVHAPRVFFRRTSESVVLLGTSDLPEVLHGTGLAVWDAFASPATITEVIAKLVQAYDADVERVTRETVPLVEALVRDGLLTRAQR